MIKRRLSKLEQQFKQLLELHAQALAAVATLTAALASAAANHEKRGLSTAPKAVKQRRYRANLKLKVERVTERVTPGEHVPGGNPRVKPTSITKGNAVTERVTAPKLRVVAKIVRAPVARAAFETKKKAKSLKQKLRPAPEVVQVQGTEKKPAALSQKSLDYLALQKAWCERWRLEKPRSNGYPWTAPRDGKAASALLALRLDGDGQELTLADALRTIDGLWMRLKSARDRDLVFYRKHMTLMACVRWAPELLELAPATSYAAPCACGFACSKPCGRTPAQAQEDVKLFVEEEERRREEASERARLQTLEQAAAAAAEDRERKKRPQVATKAIREILAGITEVANGGRSK